MIVPKEILTQHVAILGKTRSGKSSVMRLLVESLLERQLPVCIVDPKGDWYGIKLAADGKRPGYPVVIFGGEHADIPINEHAGAHVAELFATGNRPCLIDLGGWMVAPRTRFWIDFASTLFKHTKGQRWLAVDEIHNFAPKGKVFDADAGKALHWTNRLASEGLGKGVAMVFASQRPQKVHNDTLTSAETLIAMRVLHPSDRGAVADWIKGCGDSEGSEVLNSLAQMERGEGWVWSPEIGFGPKRVKFPLFHTYDSFRPQSIEDTKKLKGWAEVDLDDVRTKMAATIEKAKADDPRELRKQIAELQRKVASGSSPSNVVAKQEVKRVEILTDGDRALLGKVAVAIDSIKLTYSERAGKLLQSFIDAHLSVIENAGRDLESRLDGRGFQKVLGKLSALSPQPPAPSSHGPAKAGHYRQPEESRANPGQPAKQPGGSRNGARPADGESIGGGLRRILIALAQRRAGLTLRQIGVRAALSSKSGTFSTYMSRGRQQGWIQDGGKGGPSTITEAGVEALGEYEPLPTGQELLKYWVGDLGGGAARILQTVAAAYPETLTLEQIGERSNLNHQSGTFSTYMSRLRTLELIESGRGWVRASEELFS